MVALNNTHIYSKGQNLLVNSSCILQSTQHAFITQSRLLLAILAKNKHMKICS